MTTFGPGVWCQRMCMHAICNACVMTRRIASAPHCAIATVIPKLEAARAHDDVLCQKFGKAAKRKQCIRDWRQ